MSEQSLEKGMHVEVKTDDDGFKGAWYVAKIIQVPTPMENYVQVEYNELLNPDDQSKKLIEKVPVSSVRPSPPQKGFNEVIEVNDVVDAFYNDGWWTGVVGDVLDDGREVVVSFDYPGPHKMVFNRSDVRVHFDWVDGKWEKSPEKSKQSTNVSTKGDGGLKRKRGRPKLLSKNKTGEGSTIAKGSTWKRVTKDSCVVDEAEISAEKNRLMLTTIDKPNEDHLQPLSKDSMMVTTNEQQTGGVRGHNVLCSETAIIPLLENLEDETVLIKRVKRHKNSLSKEHNQMSKIVDSESQYQECDNASRGDSSLHEVYHSKGADMLIDGIPAHDLNEDQVSNSRIQLDKPSPTDHSDDLRSLPVQRQCANVNGMQDDFGSPVVRKDRKEPGPLQKTDGSSSRADSDDKGGELGTPSASLCVDNVENCQSLPFLKGSPFWKDIESMEIFRKMKKKPHFSPLLKCNEVTREGLAIGHMVNFSNLVANVSKLQFCHPITVIETNLKLVAELESHGFDVETVQARLTQLLSKKHREAELQKESQDIGNMISNTVEEISKADEEIAKLKKMITELSAKLDDTISMKEKKDSMISTLKSKQDEVGENLRRLQTDFENIAGAAL